jgi:hypothetical protein
MMYPNGVVPERPESVSHAATSIVTVVKAALGRLCADDWYILNIGGSAQKAIYAAICVISDAVRTCPVVNDGSVGTERAGISCPPP